MHVLQQGPSGLDYISPQLNALRLVAVGDVSPSAPSAPLCPSLLSKVCDTAFCEKALEISQNKQNLPIRFVKPGRGVVHTQMVGRCDVSSRPARHCPAPALPAAQATVPALGGVCWRGPLCTRTVVICRGVWSSKTLFWAQHRSIWCCTGPTTVTRMRNSVF